MPALVQDTFAEDAVAVDCLFVCLFLGKRRGFYQDLFAPRVCACLNVFLFIVLLTPALEPPRYSYWLQTAERPMKPLCTITFRPHRGISFISHSTAAAIAADILARGFYVGVHAADCPMKTT